MEKIILWVEWLGKEHAKAEAMGSSAGGRVANENPPAMACGTCGRPVDVSLDLVLFVTFQLRYVISEKRFVQTTYF